MAETQLSERECWEHLRNEAYGRLAVVGEDGPVIFPINAIVDHGSVVFRTAAGAKLTAMRADPRVAFEVDGWNTTDGVAWSVLVTGLAREVVGMLEGADVTELGVTPWQSGPKPTYIRIVTASITGRTFRRSDRTN